MGIERTREGSSCAGCSTRRRRGVVVSASALATKVRKVFGLDRVSAGPPVSVQHAGLALGAALIAASLACVAFVRILPPSSTTPRAPIVALAGAMTLGLWRPALRLLNPFFLLSVGRIPAKASVTLVHDVAPSGALSAIAVGLAFFCIESTAPGEMGGPSSWLVYMALGLVGIQLVIIARRVRVLSLDEGSARIGGALQRGTPIRDAASHGGTLELETESRAWILRFHTERTGPVGEALALAIRTRLRARLGPEAGAFRTAVVAPSAERADGPAREIEGVTTEAPDLLRLAVAGWGAGLVLAALLCWLFDETMFWALGAERRSDLPVAPIVGALVAFACATWRWCAGVLEPLFRKDQLDINDPSPRRAHILALDLPVARLGSLVACLVTYFWVAPYSVKNSSLGASDLFSATLSHATVLYMLGYGWLVLRHTRLLWLNRHTALIGRVYESPLRVSAASGEAGGIELLAGGRLWRVRVKGPEAPRVAARLLEAIRARIGGRPSSDVELDRQ